MDVMTPPEGASLDPRLARAWWLFLVTGIAWVVVSFVVLGLKPDAPAAIGYLTAFVLIAAGINELASIGFAEGWKWLHVVLGALFIVAGVLALISPLQTFGVLALLIGWYLLFKGLFDVVLSIALRGEVHLWGLLLGAGVIQIAIGIWAIGYPGRSAWLLVLWVGIAALMRGITEIALAFRLRGANS